MIPWIKSLESDGNHVSIWADYVGPSESYDYGAHLKLVQSTMSRLLEKVVGQGKGYRPYLFSGPFSLFVQILKQRPDVIIIREPKRIGSLMVLALSCLCGIKSVIYSLSDFNKWSARKKRHASFFLKLFRLSWISPIADVKSEDSPPFYRVPFIINKRPARIRIRSGLPMILMVGKYGSRRKNHDLLMEAIARIHHFTPLRCTIIGSVNSIVVEDDCSFIRLINLARDLKLSGVIKFLTNIPHQEMEIYYSNADLFVLPASNEPAGISVLEALGFGLPVICSDTCGLKQYVKGSGGGIVFKTDDLEDLTQCILEGLENLGQLEANAGLSHEGYSAGMFLDAFYKIMRAS